MWWECDVEMCRGSDLRTWFSLNSKLQSFFRSAGTQTISEGADLWPRSTKYYMTLLIFISAIYKTVSNTSECSRSRCIPKLKPAHVNAKCKSCKEVCKGGRFGSGAPSKDEACCLCFWLFVYPEFHCSPNSIELQTSSVTFSDGSFSKDIPSRKDEAELSFKASDYPYFEIRRQGVRSAGKPRNLAVDGVACGGWYHEQLINAVKCCQAILLAYCLVMLVSRLGLWSAKSIPGNFAVLPSFSGSRY